MARTYYHRSRRGRGSGRDSDTAVHRALREWRGIDDPPDAVARRPVPDVGPSVRRVVDRLGLGRRMKESILLDRWAEFVGEEIAAHARPDRYDDGTLTVRVDHPAWMFELRSMQKLMIRRINDGVGRAFVRTIIFRADG